MYYNRERKPYNLLSLGGVDEYGQRHFVETGEYVVGVLGLYSHRPVEDIRYQDVDYYLLTQDDLNDKMAIKINDNIYKVVFVNNYGRLKEGFLKKWVLR